MTSSLAADIARHRYCVYALLCPYFKRVRYVGFTSDIHQRYARHLYCVPEETTRDWIAGLVKRNRRPVLVVLQHCESRDEGMKAEYRWIARFLRHGCNLLNRTKTPRTYSRTMMPRLGLSTRTFKPINKQRSRAELEECRLALRAKRLAQWEAREQRRRERRATA